jgi:hypothetical protein
LMSSSATATVWASFVKLFGRDLRSGSDQFS